MAHTLKVLASIPGPLAYNMAMDEVYPPKQNELRQRSLSKVPNYIAPSIRDIDYPELFRQGVRHFVFDIDNTLVSFGKPALDERTRTFLLALKKRPEVCCVRLASNSRRDLSRFGLAIGIDVMKPQSWSMKPFASYYRRILRHTGAQDNPKSAVMIGDKLIQDIWGANHVGMTTVLVRPVGHDHWFDRLVRTRDRERFLLRRLLPRHREKWF